MMDEVSKSIRYLKYLRVHEEKKIWRGESDAKVYS